MGYYSLGERIFLFCLAVFCLGLVLLLPVACISSIKAEEAKQKELKEDNCKQVLEVKTGKRVYCGKACWRDEIRQEFSCNSGTRVVIQ